VWKVEGLRVFSLHCHLFYCNAGIWQGSISLGNTTATIQYGTTVCRTDWCCAWWWVWRTVHADGSSSVTLDTDSASSYVTGLFMWLYSLSVSYKWCDDEHLWIRLS